VKRLLLDTNVLISFLTNRNRAQQDRATELLESAADGHLDLLVHQAVLFELAHVLLNLYGRKPEEVRQILEGLLSLPGVVPGTKSRASLVPLSRSPPVPELRRAGRFLESSLAGRGPPGRDPASGYHRHG